METRKYKLKEICQILNGRAYSQDELLSSGKYSVLRVGNFFSSDRWYYSDLELPEDKYCQDGDLLYAWSASFGPRIWKGAKTIYHYHIWKIIPLEWVDKYYLYYWLLASARQLTSGIHGSVMAHLTKSDMEGKIIQIPSTEEQRKVSSILHSLDQKIENNAAINRNLEEQAKAYFDEIILNRSAGQQRGKLSEFIRVNPQRSLKANTLARSIEMKNLPTVGSFSIDWDFKPFSGGMKFTNGDTIIARITPCLENGKTAYINFLEKNEVAFGSTEYIVLTPHSGYPSELCYFIARNQNFRDYAIQNMNGSSGRQRVSALSIDEYELQVPSKENAQKFAILAGPIMRMIRDNALENRKLAELRDTLLPKLMFEKSSVDIGIYKSYTTRGKR